ncbi:UNVERIFIED_CONTAM: Basic form of pathogenesis-related protein 1 [Sesamum calycinum]|uniref:Basic form of pathogenesis-related protein 1 n=1 Tax=Sesamum calycinum TaxID=2727403 RepID=A0AAW2R7C6_9LAMI
MHKPMSLALFFFAIATILQYPSCHAQNSPQDYLPNAARAQVGVGPIAWDEKVAAFARNYVNQRVGDCNLVHSTNRPYGEKPCQGARRVHRPGSGGFVGRGEALLRPLVEFLCWRRVSALHTGGVAQLGTGRLCEGSMQQRVVVHFLQL